MLEENSKNGQRGLFISGMIVGLAGALGIGAAVYLGNGIQSWLNRKQGGEVVFSEDSAVTPQLVGKLQLLEETIDEYFYLHDVADEELQEGIYKGLLEALDDPYSEYYTAEELRLVEEGLQGSYYGIGAYVGLDAELNLPRITGVIEGSPAKEADLRANDLIYEVDGASVQGKSLTEVVALIKGEENTQVTLTIIRENDADYLSIPVTRRKVDKQTVDFKMFDVGMAYIQITEFDEVTPDQFTDALAMAKGSDMKGLILDLRANPGGNLTAVTEIARMILPEGLILYTEDKKGERVDYTCDGSRQLQVPMVVLVDMNSASAAEVLAGAIKDHGIGTLVGTTTFGKGIVQQLVPLSDGSAIKMTISSYFTPSGADIHGIGIEPDVVCEFDGEAYYQSENPYDNQLEKAREVLAEKIAGS